MCWWSRLQGIQQQQRDGYYYMLMLLLSTLQDTGYSNLCIVRTTFLFPLLNEATSDALMRACLQAAKMLQIGAKVVDAVRMGPKPVLKAKAAPPAPRPPREGTQPAKQSDQGQKPVPEQR